MDEGYIHSYPTSLGRVRERQSVGRRGMGRGSIVTGTCQSCGAPSSLTGLGKDSDPRSRLQTVKQQCNGQGSGGQLVKETKGRKTC